MMRGFSRSRLSFRVAVQSSFVHENVESYCRLLCPCSSRLPAEFITLHENKELRPFPRVHVVDPGKTNDKCQTKSIAVGMALTGHLPAQIRTCRITAYGSYLGYRRLNLTLG